MSRNTRGGLQQNVAIALGMTHTVDAARPEAINCTCGKTKQFVFNTIGQMVEVCDGCGRRQLYRGPKMLTRADKETEQGRRIDGDWDGRYKQYGQRRKDQA